MGSRHGFPFPGACYQHQVPITNGDVTSDPETTVSQVESVVAGIVKTYITENKLQKSDMFQVVQIFDMDGAYIPDEAVIRGSSGKFYYTPTNISCLAPGDAITRNEHKRSLMDALLKLDSVYGINYEKYFMSCNLDHVLYDEQNLDADEKLERAYEFHLAFQDQEQIFPVFSFFFSATLPHILSLSLLANIYPASSPG